jgi:hypothetical protein
MQSGKISGFYNGKGYGRAGGGVSVSNNSWFFMNGGKIANSKSYSGGGVYAGYSSTFVMNGGTISGNDAFQGEECWQAGTARLS